MKIEWAIGNNAHNRCPQCLYAIYTTSADVIQTSALIYMGRPVIAAKTIKLMMEVRQQITKSGTCTNAGATLRRVLGSHVKHILAYRANQKPVLAITENKPYTSFRYP